MPHSTTMRLLCFVLVLGASPLLHAAETPSDYLIDVAAQASPDPRAPLTHLAILLEAADGTQRISVRTVYSERVPTRAGLVAGDRFADDGMIELSTVWGPRGPRAVDLLVAAAPVPGGDWPIDDFGSPLPTPDRLLVLAEDGRIAELRGIWGTGGVAIPDLDWIPDPAHWTPGAATWVVHETGLDTATYGAATCFAEGVRGFDAPPPELDRKFLDPVFAVGTAGGYVSLMRFEVGDPAAWVLDPTSAFENPIISLDERPIATSLVGGIESLMTVRYATRGTSRMDFLAMSQGDFVRIDPGLSDARSPMRSAIPAQTAVVTDDLGFATDIDGEKLAYGPAGEILLPGGRFFLGSQIVTADGTSVVRVGVMPGDHVTYDPAQVLTLSRPVDRVASGSLVALTSDRESALLVPSFDPADPAASQGQDVLVGGVQSVVLGPQSFQLRARGHFYTASIEASGTDIFGISGASVSLTVSGLRGVPATVWPLRQSIEDEDSDGNLELVTKFDRQALAALLQLVHARGAGHAGLMLSWEYQEECAVGVRCKSSVARVIRLVH